MAIQIGCTITILKKLAYPMRRRSERQGPCQLPFFRMRHSQYPEDGDMPISHWNSIDGGFLLDVHNPAQAAVRLCRVRCTSANELRSRLSSTRNREHSCILPIRSAFLMFHTNPSSERIQRRNIYRGMISALVHRINSFVARLLYNSQHTYGETGDIWSRASARIRTTMKPWPKNPVIYEINTWVWLEELAKNTADR